MCGGLEVQVNGSLSETRLYRRPPHPKEDRRTNPRGGVHAPALWLSAGARPPHSRARRRAQRTHSAARSAQSRSAGSSAGTEALTSPAQGRPQSHTTAESSTRDGISLTFVAEHIVRALRTRTSCAHRTCIPHVHQRCTQHVHHMSTSHVHLLCTSHVHLMCTSHAHLMRTPHVHLMCT